MKNILNEVERERIRDPFFDEMLKTLRENHWSEKVILKDEIDQRVLHEYWVEKKTPEEIAAGLGIKKELLSNIKHRARRTLRRYVIKKQIVMSVDSGTEETMFPVLDFDYDVREVMLVPDEGKVEVIKRILSLPIDEIEMTVRTFNCLKSEQINYFNDILAYHRPYDFYKLRNFGWKSLDELQTLMTEWGIKWRENPAKREIKKRIVERTHIWLPLNYHLTNFSWSPKALRAFAKYRLMTINDLLKARQVLAEDAKLSPHEIMTIQTRIKEWGLNWE